MRIKFFGVIIAIALCGTFCSAGDFSFTGNFSNVNQVQLFTFTVSNGSKVVIQSYGYAGGTNGAGAVIQRGGFDPSIALFYGTSSTAPLYKTADDEYGCAEGVRDSATRVCYDVYWEGTAQYADPNSDVMAFEPGTYTLALTNYGNAAKGLTLGSGFTATGSAFDCNGNARAIAASGFADCLRSARDGHWALDIRGVDSAQLGNTQTLAATVVTIPVATGGGGGGNSGGGSGRGGNGGSAVSVSGSGRGGNGGGGGEVGTVTTTSTTTPTTGTVVPTVTGETTRGGGGGGGGQLSGGGSGRGGNGGGGGRGGETVVPTTITNTIFTTPTTSGSASGTSNGTAGTTTVTGDGTIVQQFSGEVRGGNGGGSGRGGHGGDSGGSGGGHGGRGGR
jgi:hypothetical protein